MLKAKCFKHETVSLDICAFCGVLVVYLPVSSRLVTVLRAELFGVWIHAGAKVFCRLRNVQTGPWAHPAPSSVGTGVLFPGVKCQGRQVDLSPPLPRLKMNGAIPLLLSVRLHVAEGDRDPFLPLFFKYALAYQVASSGLPTKSVCIFDPIRTTYAVSLVFSLFVCLTTQSQMHGFILWTKKVTKKFGRF